MTLHKRSMKLKLEGENVENSSVIWRLSYSEPFYFPNKRYQSIKDKMRKFENPWRIQIVRKYYLKYWVLSPLIFLNIFNVICVHIFNIFGPFGYYISLSMHRLNGRVSVTNLDQVGKWHDFGISGCTCSILEWSSKGI